MSMLRYYAALVAAVATLSYTSYPLRALAFDDQDATFFTYDGPAGIWDHYQGGGWPGEGVRNNTGTSVRAVQPGQLVQVTSRAFYTAGTPEEGLVLYLANESSGPLEVYLDGQLVATLGYLGYYNSLRSQLYDMRRGGATTAESADYLPYGNANEPFRPVTLFTPGWHTLTLVKRVNAAAGDTNGNDRATYFDGCTLYTRHPTFS
jgi:hypothetical protein